MATKMAVYNKKYKKIFPETGKLQEFACKVLFYWYLNYKHYPCNIPVILLNTSYRKWYIQDDVQDGNNKFYNPVRAASYL